MTDNFTTRPDYTVTGYGLKIMSYGKELKSCECHDIKPGGFESLSYESLRRSFPSLDSDDYYFVLCPRQERGLGAETIDTIVGACAEYQKNVIVSGDLSVFKPMGLKDIEEKCGYDKSTISRACRGACIYTAHRNYTLNSESSSSTYVGLFNQVIDGDVSTHVVRDKIKDIIDNEDKSTPLSDEQIVECLSKFGLDVARRTVVKYRGQLGLQNSRNRKAA